MKKTCIILIVSLYTSLFTFFVNAQIPPGYYDPANGLTGQPLQSALHNIIKNHMVVSYTSLWTYFQNTDKKSNGTVWDMYSDVPGGTPPYVFQFGSDQCGNYSSEGDCYNREHSWPKSWFGDTPPMNSDIFHLYPTDGYVNGKRDNYPYGEVGTASWTSLNGSKVGNCTTTGYTGVVFEPIDTYKGDFARTYFYMSVRYYTEDGGWPGSPMTTGSQLKPWALAMMLQWNSQDPVSQKETDRNNYIYNQVQHNRNPFIDHPEYAEAIWGPVSGTYDKVNTNSLCVYPMPATSECYITLPLDEQPPFTIEFVSNTGGYFKLQPDFENNQLKVNLLSFPAGFYILMLKSEKSHSTYFGKLIKQ